MAGERHGRDLVHVTLSHLTFCTYLKVSAQIGSWMVEYLKISGLWTKWSYSLEYLSPPVDVGGSEMGCIPGSLTLMDLQELKTDKPKSRPNKFEDTS